ncbi:hypothetical protein Tco_0503873 [Tanacetum coccineum]
MASIVSYSLVICAFAWYLNNGSIEYHETSFLIIYSLGKFFNGHTIWLPSNVISWGLLMQIRTYPPLDDCQLWETLGSTISVSIEGKTLLYGIELTLPSNVISWGFLMQIRSTSELDMDHYAQRLFCGNKLFYETYLLSDDCQLWETVGSTIRVSVKERNTSLVAWLPSNVISWGPLMQIRTYPPLDDCQLWETLGSTISVSMKDMNTSLWNWNSTYGFYQYCPMASIVSYSLVICASAWYLNNGSIEYHENSFLIIYSLGKFFKGAHSFGLASCCTPCVSNVSSLWSCSGVLDGLIFSYSLVICAFAWYLNNGSIEYHENSFLIIYSLGKFFKGAHSFGLASCCTPCVSNVSSLWLPSNVISWGLLMQIRTYPPLDDCQLWETLGSTISVSMKDMNTSLWNWNSTYDFYQYCPMASIVSYSLVICASAWYLNNGSIEYHENSFLIIYSLGKFFKGAHSFGLASCCTPCVSNVSSLWSVLLS